MTFSGIISQESSYQANQNQNYNQKSPQNNQQQPYQNANRNNVNRSSNYQIPPQNNQTFDQYEYQGLYNLGLDIVENNGFLVVTGENQYAYKDAIKACGFRFDSKSKTWYKAIESAA